MHVGLPLQIEYVFKGCHLHGGLKVMFVSQQWIVLRALDENVYIYKVGRTQQIHVMKTELTILGAKIELTIVEHNILKPSLTEN